MQDWGEWYDESGTLLLLHQLVSTVTSVHEAAPLVAVYREWGTAKMVHLIFAQAEALRGSLRMLGTDVCSKMLS